MQTALYLIPCPMGETPNEQVLPSYNFEIVKNIRHFIVESRKAAVRFLISLDKNFPIDDCTFTELSEHTDQKADLSKILLPLEKGESMGVRGSLPLGCNGFAIFACPHCGDTPQRPARKQLARLANLNS